MKQGFALWAAFVVLFEIRYCFLQAAAKEIQAQAL